MKVCQDVVKIAVDRPPPRKVKLLHIRFNDLSMPIFGGNIGAYNSAVSIIWGRGRREQIAKHIAVILGYVRSIVELTQNLQKAQERYIVLKIMLCDREPHKTVK